MAETNPNDPPCDSGADSAIPADWKERLLAILCREGITQPEHRSAWLSWTITMGKIFGMLAILIPSSIVVAGLIYISMDAMGLKPHGSIFVVTMAIPFFLFVPWIRRLGHESHGDTLGRNPSRLIASSQGPPVLYLRSFAMDRVMENKFAGMEASRITPAIVPEVESCEISLVATISGFARVLAIGRPGEPSPPSGAARFYVPHDQWQSTISEIVPLCRLVIWTTGQTPGLNWEIRHLIQAVSPQRLLLWPHVHILALTPEERQRQWEQFRQMFHDVFPRPLPRDVEEARFIAFEDDWTPEPIPGPRWRASRFARWWYGPQAAHLRVWLKQRL